MIKAGKKTREWERVRKILKKQFEEAGITTCEVRLEGCKNNSYLSFAHVDKRNKLGEGELYKVILACIPCHDKIEYHSVEYTGLSMRDFVESVIKSR